MDHNSKEVFVKFAPQLSENRSIGAISIDKELIDDQSSIVSLDSHVNSVTDKGDGFHYDYDFDEGPEFTELNKVKNLRKKQKRKNYHGVGKRFVPRSRSQVLLNSLLRTHAF